MDEQELRVWREVRDSADENALTIHCGSDDLGPEARLRAALVDDRTRPTGLVGMVDIHRQRARQTKDAEWAQAHQTAHERYVMRLELTELALRDVLFGSGLAGGGGRAAGTMVVLLARERGGHFGADREWLERALAELEEARCDEAVRVVGRELLTLMRREQSLWEGRRRRHLVSFDEVPDTSWLVLRVMWAVATTEEHRREVVAALEARALSALGGGSGDDLYLARLFQQRVLARPFAPWLEVLVDQALADRLQAHLGITQASAPTR